MDSNQSPALLQAIQLLQQGHPVALPTETVYGLAAPITNESALGKIFSIKQRPFFDPLIVHVNSIEMAKTCFQEWPSIAQTLAQKFWPGPLTLVMKKSSLIPGLVTSGLENVGVRWPRHDLFNEVIRQMSTPLAAPSANLFGRTSPTIAQHVKDEFAQKVFVVDGGPCQVGIESTVLLIESNSLGAAQNFQLSLLRQGQVSENQITDSLALEKNWSWLPLEKVNPKSSPGHMKHHYMPSIPLILVQGQQEEAQLLKKIEKRFQEIPDVVESVKIIKPQWPLKNIATLTLSKDSVLAARQLYAELRSASQSDADLILFQCLALHSSPDWQSIMDRLQKAASLIID